MLLTVATALLSAVTTQEGVGIESKATVMAGAQIFLGGVPPGPHPASIYKAYLSIVCLDLEH